MLLCFSDANSQQLVQNFKNLARNQKLQIDNEIEKLGTILSQVNAS